MPELTNDQPHQSPKQSHAEDHTKQSGATSREDHCWRTDGFTAGRSTTKQIFNLRILCKKYLQHHQDPYHVFIDFKKAFDRIWHAALWATMKKYISANLIWVIKYFYDKATNAVLLNNSITD